jgi:large subunit ribosomal protein L19
MNLIQEIEKTYLRADHPHFKVGDEINVVMKLNEEGRTQSFKGVLIARKNCSVRSSITVRKTTLGVAVEKVFPLHSPLITITRLKKGLVRRAKLYYLRNLAGRAARIKEDVRKDKN